MLKSCKYCGRIHDPRNICAARQMSAQRYMYRSGTDADRFRRTKTWTDMSLLIRERDHFICLCCKEQILMDRVNSNRMMTDNDGLSVHHIVPIEEDFESRLDERNLITVCSVHHELCEKQEITRQVQRELVAKSIEAREENTLAVI